MPELDGIQATRALRERVPGTRVLAFTSAPEWHEA
jgi:DNA-binding NarL/FixJ family response regulator